MKIVELGLLLKVDPEAASARILEAYRKSDGRVPAAASMLGVGARSLVRWTTELELRPELDKIREAAGRLPSYDYAESSGLTAREGGIFYGSYYDSGGKRIIRSTRTRNRAEATRVLAGWTAQVRRSQRPQRPDALVYSAHRARVPRRAPRRA